MKKLFVLFAIASIGFVACNNEEKKAEETVPAATTDTNTAAAPVDTSHATTDTSHAATVDTTKK